MKSMFLRGVPAQKRGPGRSWAGYLTCTDRTSDFARRDRPASTRDARGRDSSDLAPANRPWRCDRLCRCPCTGEVVTSAVTADDKVVALREVFLPARAVPEHAVAFGAQFLVGYDQTGACHFQRGGLIAVIAGVLFVVRIGGVISASAAVAARMKRCRVTIAASRRPFCLGLPFNSTLVLATPFA
jgi:hypothetical protein